ncbi:MAG: YlxR family protein [Eubacteriales bacterium]
MKKIPQRMCVSCRVRRNKADLTRVVLMPDGLVSIDSTGKKPGRGAYVCKNKDCLAQAIKTHRFDRGLKTEISSEVIETLLQEANLYIDITDTRLEEE